MNIVNYISSSAIPVIMLLIIIYGVLERNRVYDTFVEGAKEGIEVVVSIFPTLIGVFIAVGALRSSGILDLIIKFIAPITNILKMHKKCIFFCFFVTFCRTFCYNINK